MLSQIEHPAIPQLLGVIHTPKIYAFILEYKKGDTLAELLFKRNVSFTTEQIFNIGLQLIDIVKYLHRKGIVHRDISVANVLLYEGKISLIDFGLARWADHQDYRFDNDFSYIGDLFLYLLYSSFGAPTGKSRPWHEELLITPLQKQFLKRMLRLEQPFQYIDEVEESFQASFGMDS